MLGAVRRDSPHRFDAARPIGVLVVGLLLACGCRSLSERSFVTKCSSMEDYEQQEEDKSDAGAANFFGQLIEGVVCLATSH
jgi:hypothetical protein